MTQFDQIDAACTRRAWALACALTGNAADADDVMQQAFIVAWRRVKDIPAEPWPWMASVVANCARNHGRGRARKRKREAAFVSAAPAQYSEPTSSLEQQELRSLLASALDDLPEAEREAIVLCHMGGLTQQEASVATGVNLNTLKARSSRGMAHLREKLAASAAALEGYLATVAFPPPPGGFEAATSRWKEGAATPVTPPAASPFAAFAGIGAAVGVCVVLLLAWILSGESAAASEHTFVTPTALDGAPIIAFTPTPSPLPVLDSDADELGVFDSGNAARAAMLRPAPELPDANAGLDDIELTELGHDAKLVNRVSTYQSGEKLMEWTELILPHHAELHGSFTTYYKSGGLRDVGQFLHGKQNGTWRSYHENSALESRGDYLDNAQHGEWQYFDESGVKIGEDRFVKGKRQGTSTWWHPNGQVRRVLTFVDDRAEGIGTEYDTNGTKRLEITYKAGRKDGPQYEYDEFGNLIATTINVPQARNTEPGEEPKTRTTGPAPYDYK